MTRPQREESIPANRMLAAFEQQRAELRSLIAMKLGSHASASVCDILQEVAIAASAPPEARMKNPNAWLRTVTMNKINDYWRKFGRENRFKECLSVESTTTEHASPPPSDWVMEIENRTAVATALGTLSQEHRELLKWKYFNGCSYQEMAQKLNITTKTLEYRLVCARQSLRAALSRAQ